MELGLRLLSGLVWEGVEPVLPVLVGALDSVLEALVVVSGVVSGVMTLSVVASPELLIVAPAGPASPVVTVLVVVVLELALIWMVSWSSVVVPVLIIVLLWLLRSLDWDLNWCLAGFLLFLEVLN